MHADTLHRRDVETVDDQRDAAVDDDVRLGGDGAAERPVGQRRPHDGGSRHPAADTHTGQHQPP